MTDHFDKNDGKKTRRFSSLFTKRKSTDATAKTNPKTVSDRKQANEIHEEPGNQVLYMCNRLLQHLDNLPHHKKSKLYSTKALMLFLRKVKAIVTENVGFLSMIETQIGAVSNESADQKHNESAKTYNLGLLQNYLLQVMAVLDKVERPNRLLVLTGSHSFFKKKEAELVKLLLILRRTFSRYEKVTSMKVGKVATKRQTNDLESPQSALGIPSETNKQWNGDQESDEQEDNEFENEFENDKWDEDGQSEKQGFREHNKKEMEHSFGNNRRRHSNSESSDESLPQENEEYESKIDEEDRELEHTDGFEYEHNQANPEISYVSDNTDGGNTFWEGHESNYRVGENDQDSYCSGEGESQHRGSFGNEYDENHSMNDIRQTAEEEEKKEEKEQEQQQQQQQQQDSDYSTHQTSHKVTKQYPEYTVNSKLFQAQPSTTQIKSKSRSPTAHRARSQSHDSNANPPGFPEHNSPTRPVETSSRTAANSYLKGMQFLINKTHTSRRNAFVCFLGSASNGHVPAMTQLAFLYRDGVGCIKDLDKAESWLSRAVELNDIDAIDALSQLITTEQNMYKFTSSQKRERCEKGIELAIRAAKAGHSESAFRVGKWTLTGELCVKVPCETKEAIEFLTISSSLGNSNASNLLGVLHMQGGLPGLIERDPCKAVQYFSESASEGNILALVNAGFCLETGCGVDRSLSDAFDMYAQAAQQGHAQAMCSAGYVAIRLALANKRNVSPANTYATEGLSWLRKAAVHDINDAYFHLGSLFESGTLVMKDIERALSYYLAALGSSQVGIAPPLVKGQCLHPMSAYHVAQLMYNRGGGNRPKSRDSNGRWVVEPSDERIKAAHYYRLASRGGYAPAQNALGLLYETGACGLTTDKHAAEQWYRAAIAQGQADAHVNLALLLLAKNPESSEAWQLIKVATRTGHVKAQSMFTLRESLLLRRDLAAPIYPPSLDNAITCNGYTAGRNGHLARQNEDNSGRNEHFMGYNGDITGINEYTTGGNNYIRTGNDYISGSNGSQDVVVVSEGDNDESGESEDSVVVSASSSVLTLKLRSLGWMAAAAPRVARLDKGRDGIGHARVPLDESGDFKVSEKEVSSVDACGVVGVGNGSIESSGSPNGAISISNYVDRRGSYSGGNDGRPHSNYIVSSGQARAKSEIHESRVENGGVATEGRLVSKQDVFETTVTDAGGAVVRRVRQTEHTRENVLVPEVGSQEGAEMLGQQHNVAEKDDTDEDEKEEVPSVEMAEEEVSELIESLEAGTAGVEVVSGECDSCSRKIDEVGVGNDQEEHNEAKSYSFGHQRELVGIAEEEEEEEWFDAEESLSLDQEQSTRDPVAKSNINSITQQVTKSKVQPALSFEEELHAQSHYQRKMKTSTSYQHHNESHLHANNQPATQQAEHRTQAKNQQTNTKEKASTNSSIQVHKTNERNTGVVNCEYSIPTNTSQLVTGKTKPNIAHGDYIDGNINGKSLASLHPQRKHIIKQETRSNSQVNKDNQRNTGMVNFSQPERVATESNTIHDDYLEGIKNEEASASLNQFYNEPYAQGYRASDISEHGNFSSNYYESPSDATNSIGSLPGIQSSGQEVEKKAESENNGVESGNDDSSAELPVLDIDPDDSNPDFLVYLQNQVRLCFEESAGNQTTTYRSIRTSVSNRTGYEYAGRSWRRWFRNEVDLLLHEAEEDAQN